MTSGSSEGETSSIFGLIFRVLPTGGIDNDVFFLSKYFHVYPVPTPAMNPPICAKYATPPTPDCPINVNSICKINQKGMKASAGIRIVVIRNTIIMVYIFALGNIIKYAPKTPEIAKDAPMAGNSAPSTETA